MSLFDFSVMVLVFFFQIPDLLLAAADVDVYLDRERPGQFLKAGGFGSNDPDSSCCYTGDGLWGNTFLEIPGICTEMKMFEEIMMTECGVERTFSCPFLTSEGTASPYSIENGFFGLVIKLPSAFEFQDTSFTFRIEDSDTDEEISFIIFHSEEGTNDIMAAITVHGNENQFDLGDLMLVYGVSHLPWFEFGWVLLNDRIQLILDGHQLGSRPLGANHQFGENSYMEIFSDTYGEDGTTTYSVKKLRIYYGFSSATWPCDWENSHTIPCETTTEETAADTNPTTIEETVADTDPTTIEETVADTDPTTIEETAADTVTSPDEDTMINTADTTNTDIPTETETEDSIGVTNGGSNQALYIVFGSLGGVIVLFAILILILLVVIVSTIVIRKKNFKRKMGEIENGVEMAETTFDDIDIKDTEKAMAHLLLNKNLFQLDISDVKVKRSIGSGGFAKVYLCHLNGEDVAFKCFDTKMIGDSEHDFSLFEKELTLIASLRHSSLPHFYGACLKPPRVSPHLRCFVLTYHRLKVGYVIEYCAQGDLERYIKENPGTLSVEEKVRIFKEISIGVSYLHKMKVIHRDLKPQNILLTDHLKSKIIDFGLSKLLDRNEQSGKTRNIGTSIFMAPEVMSGEYSFPADMYSMGILMWCVITEDFEPFGKSFNIQVKIQKNPDFRPSIEELFKELGPKNSYVRKLIVSSWDQRPQKRPTFADLAKAFK